MRSAAIVAVPGGIGVLFLVAGVWLVMRPHSRPQGALACLILAGTCWRIAASIARATQPTAATQPGPALERPTV